MPVVAQQDEQRGTVKVKCLEHSEIVCLGERDERGQGAKFSDPSSHTMRAQRKSWARTIPLKSFPGNIAGQALKDRWYQDNKAMATWGLGIGKRLTVAELWKSYQQETQPCDTLGTYPKVLGSSHKPAVSSCKHHFPKLEGLSFGGLRMVFAGGFVCF